MYKLKLGKSGGEWRMGFYSMSGASSKQTPAALYRAEDIYKQSH